MRGAECPSRARSLATVLPSVMLRRSLALLVAIGAGVLSCSGGAGDTRDLTSVVRAHCEGEEEGLRLRLRGLREGRALTSMSVYGALLADDTPLRIAQSPVRRAGAGGRGATGAGGERLSQRVRLLTDELVGERQDRARVERTMAALADVAHEINALPLRD